MMVLMTKADPDHVVGNDEDDDDDCTQSQDGLQSKKEDIVVSQRLKQR